MGRVILLLGLTGSTPEWLVFRFGSQESSHRLVVLVSLQKLADHLTIRCRAHTKSQNHSSVNDSVVSHFFILVRRYQLEAT